METTASPELLATVSTALAGPGHVVVDGLLDSAETAALRSLTDDLRSAGAFHQAGVGAGHLHPEVRGDWIHWIDPGSARPPLSRVVAIYRELIEHLNRTCYLGLRDFEAMLALYPSGTFYRRHRDRFRERAHRWVTAIVYLNPDWEPAHGGELVLYPETIGGEHPAAGGQSALPPVRVAPMGGRLLVFLSELEHEVLATTVPRYSLTAWFLDRPVGLTFLG